MVKNFNVDFKGGIASARVEDGKYSILLPYRRSKDGNQYAEWIRNDTLSEGVFGEAKKGLHFASIRVAYEGFRFDFWLLDDNTMICNDSENPQYRNIDKKFDRRAKPTSPSEELAKSVYQTFKQVKDLDRIGMPAKTAGVIRQLRLATMLKLLGYDYNAEEKSVLENSRPFYALRKIGSILENYRNLGYITRETNEDGTEDFIVDYASIPGDDHCTISKEIIERQLQDSKRYMDSHEEWLEKVRSVPGAEGILFGMEERVKEKDPEGWEAYQEVYKKTLELILGLDKDLVDSNSEDLSRLQGIDLQDKISELIDSNKFNEACAFEDRWVIDECNRAIEIFEYSGQQVEPSTVLTTKLNGLYNQVVLSREDRTKAVEKWDGYRKLFEGKTKMILKKPPENSIEEVL